MNNTEATDALVGTVLAGRYELEQRVARGGMAVVYRAFDQRLDRVVAVKIMHEGLGDDEAFARRFDREARAAAQLQHPHVVAVFDQGTFDGRPYIVLEYVDGPTLRSVIAEEAPIAPARMLRLIEPVAGVLAAAHDANIIHRDIKPENILLTRRGDVKLADFGLARALATHTASVSRGVLLGTLSYLPPELIDSQQATFESDVYSLGVVMYEMLTGQKPHTGETTMAIAHKHLHLDIGAPSQVFAEGSAERDAIPDYVDALVLACTSRTPEDRPANGRVLGGRIAQARQALADGVTHDPDLAAALSAVSDGRPSATDATVVLDAVRLDETTWVEPTGEVTPVAPQIRREAAQMTVALPEVTRPKRQKKRRGLVIATVLVVLALVGGTGAWWFVEGRYQPTPVVVGMTKAEAEQSLANAKLAVVVENEFSETVPLGLVVRSAPEGNAKVLQAGTVTLFVSKGPERFEAPSLHGLTREQAAKKLEELNLVLGSVTEDFDETAAVGVTATQNPASGTKMKRGGAVDVVISKGPKPIAITSFVGKPADEAERALTEAGFKVTTTEENSKTVPAGMVILQNPAEGTGKKGDTITLVKSKGPVMVAVPRVMGKSRDEAISMLQAAGLQADTKRGSAGGMLFNLVSASSPAGGTQVPEGSVVTLTIV